MAPPAEVVRNTKETQIIKEEEKLPDDEINFSDWGDINLFNGSGFFFGYDVQCGKISTD